MKEHLPKLKQEPKPIVKPTQPAVIVGRIGGVFMASHYPTDPKEQEDILDKIKKHKS